MLTRGQKWGLGIIGVGVLVAMSAPTKVRAMVNTGRQRKFPAEPYEVTAEDKLWLARAVDAEVGTVKSRLHRARENLRRMLAPLKSRHIGRSISHGTFG